MADAKSPLDVVKLAQAMDWVVPPDTSPGAGSPEGVRHMLQVIAELPEVERCAYATCLSTMQESDLADSTNTFAQAFIDHVRDVYYNCPGTGAWGEIGFKVTDP